MFTRRKRVTALLSAVLVGTTVVLSWSTTAQAATTGTLPPGSVVCTEKIRSSGGVAFYGSLQAPVLNSSALWTVYASATEAGPETELLRLPSRDPSTTYVKWPGTFFYRLCVTNANSAKGGMRVSFFPQGAGAVTGIGPATAVLGPSGGYCPLETIAAARLTGTSTIPVRWRVAVDNLDGESLRTEELGTSATINRQLTPGPDEMFKVCVSNPGTTTATISFDLVH